MYLVSAVIQYLHPPLFYFIAIITTGVALNGITATALIVDLAYYLLSKVTQQEIISCV